MKYTVIWYEGDDCALTSTVEHPTFDKDAILEKARRSVLPIDEPLESIESMIADKDDVSIIAILTTKNEFPFPIYVK